MGKLCSTESTEKCRWFRIYRTGRVYTFAYVHVCVLKNWAFITRCFHSSTSLKFPRQKKQKKQKDVVRSAAICYFYFLLHLFLAHVLASATFFYSTTPLALWQRSSSRDGAFCYCLKGPSLSFINPSNMSAAFLDNIINAALETPAPVQSEAQERHRAFWNCTSVYGALAKP